VERRAEQRVLDAIADYITGYVRRNCKKDVGKLKREPPDRKCGLESAQDGKTTLSWHGKIS
jgi:hypothetical protein